MARQLNNLEIVLYRAAIVVTYPYGEAFNRFYGPYLTRGAATAAINRLRRHNSNAVVRGTVEVAELDWRPDGPATN